MKGIDFYKLGCRDLISVTPPGAKLAPSSKLSSAQVGKVPGMKLANGLWVGYNWRTEQATAEKVRQWDLDGANIGLRAGNFPAIDIDCDDEKLSEGIATVASAMLGEAPTRIGRAPKRLMMFKTDSPFARMRLWFNYKGKQHLVEILGEGQQYVVCGTHPATLRPYHWARPLPQDSWEQLPELNATKALKFLNDISARIEKIGGTVVELEGDGKIRADVAPPQEDLKAPSVDAVREAVSKVPNTNEKFSDRASYLKMGYAIKASLPGNEEEALATFLDWALTWPGNDRHAGNTADIVASDWKRMRPPYVVGWSWLAEQAKPSGYEAARDEFPALAPMREEVPATPVGEKPAPDDKLVNVEVLTDHWLAARLVERVKDRLRFVPETGKYLVWDGTRWQTDATALAESTLVTALQAFAADLVKLPEFEAMRKRRKQPADKLLAEFLSTTKVWGLERLIRVDRSIAISIAQLDADPMLLNTPAGILDLRNGEVHPSNPDALCSRMTTVSRGEGTFPLWAQFLHEATDGDRDLIHYLQRLCGYALTGLTKEQHLTFLWGPGGNGKSVFVNVISRIMGDYWAQADANAFVQARGDKHPADLASLVGARLVTASETQQGRAWDEQRIKSATGGDPMSVRMMYKDFFTFRPTFKLLFTGNFKPVLKGTGDAMRRRMHLVPFLNKPAVVDLDLEQKLMAEAPEIFSWMVSGALAWQREGLNAPEVVRSATKEYFEDEDTLQAWLDERTVYDGTTFTPVAQLYQDWHEYANARGEYAGTTRTLSSNLKAKGLQAHRITNARGFIIKLNEVKPFGS